METSPPPFKTMVFVCTHQRKEGERVACANPGFDGMVLWEGLKKEVRLRGLEGKIRVCKSGCMDRCEEGANVLIVRDNGAPEWKRSLARNDLETLTREIVSGEKNSGGRA